MKEKIQITIGQKIRAAVLSDQMGISVDVAMKRYCLGQIDPSWETIGEMLLKCARLAQVGQSEISELAEKMKGMLEN
jgi:hypothetical protein